MKLSLALLADYANISREGKMNVMGVFDSIYAAAFPCKHPHMQLVTQFSLELGEEGLAREVSVVLVNPDGKVLFRHRGRLGGSAQAESTTRKSAYILQLNNTTFPSVGDHEIRISLDGELMTTLSLTLLALPTAEAN